ncbi:MAG: hypothetical protein HGB08_02680 [Candidatus Moranbacteria bacterium]|nr:hypothetical protein [Candidatus Moranbacteria bacterium]
MSNLKEKISTSSTSSEVSVKATSVPASTRLDALEIKALDIEKSLRRSEKNQDKAINFIMGIAGIIIVAFFLALIPLLFDYYRDNAERYEKFTKRIDNLDMRLKNIENKK